MKIKFNKIKTDKDNITLFNGEDNVNINKSDFNLVKTEYGAIPIDKWCKELGKVYTLDDKDYYPEFTLAQEDKLKNNKYIEISAMNFSELSGYTFESDKIYRLHINNENMTHAGTVGNELAALIKRHSNIIEIIVDKDVNIVKAYAFENCINLNRIKLLENVNSIEAGAFKGCTSLKKVNIPYKVTVINEQTFQNCESLAEVELPKYLSNIKDNAFSGCKLLDNVMLSDNLNSLGSSSFENCQKLKNLYMGKSLVSLNENAFGGCISLEKISLPNSLSTIGFGAFQGCIKLLEVNIGNDIDSIGNNTFLECNALKKITYENTVEHWKSIVTDESLIGISYNKVDIECSNGTIPEFKNLDSMTLTELEKYTFDKNINYGVSLNSENMSDTSGRLHKVICSNSNIKKVTILDDVNEILPNTFINCESIKEVDISGSVKNIGLSSFQNCNNIETLTLREGITYIDNDAFSNCRKLTSVTIPNSVNKVGNNIFDGCTNLSSVNFGTGLLSIGYGNFSHCIGLKELDIPENITTIESGAFNYCTGLIKVNTKDTLKSIEELAFGNCSSLKEFNLSGGLNSFGPNVFLGCSELSKINYNNTKENWVKLVPMIGFIGLSYGKLLVKCTDGIYVQVSEIKGKSNVELQEPDLFKKDVRYVLYLNEENVTELGTDENGSPKIVTSILQNNLNIIKVVIESSLDLPNNSFLNCNHIKEYVYPGTSEQWISLLVKKDMCISSSSTIYCNDGINVYPYDTAPKTLDKEIIMSINNFYEIGEGQELTEFIKNNGSYIHTVIIGTNLGYIGAEAFINCGQITRIIIPRTVNTIRERVFTGCTGLKEIIYTGTIKQWKSIKTIASENGLNMEQTSIVCSDGIIRNKDIELFALDENSLASYDFNTGDTYELHLSTKNINQPNLLEVLDANTSIETIDIDDDVTDITDNRFKGCKNVINVNIGNNVERIGVSAFENCKKIRNITIPDSVTDLRESSFKGSVSLETVTLGNGIEILKDKTFSNCKELKIINFGNNILTISNNVFEYCDDLVDFELVPTITSIGVEAFQYCRKLKTISGTRVSTINDRAFYNCRELLEANLEGISTLGNKVFYNCIKLRNFNMPSARNIGEKVFQNCIGLENINIINLTTSGKYAFKDCENLKIVNLSENLVAIPEGMFSGCDKLEQIKIGTSTETLGDYAFFECSSLRIVDMKNTSVNMIGTSTFEGCKKLDSIDIPNIVKSIGERAFYDCWKLESLSVSEYLKEIGKDSFRNCYNFKKFDFFAPIILWGFEDKVLEAAGLDIKDITIKGTDMKSIPQKSTIPAESDTDKLVDTVLREHTLGILTILPENTSGLGEEPIGTPKELTKYLSDNQFVDISIPFTINSLPENSFKNSNILNLTYNGSLEDFDKVLGDNNSVRYLGIDPFVTKVNCSNGSINTLLDITYKENEPLTVNANRFYRITTNKLDAKFSAEIRGKNNILELYVDDKLTEIKFNYLQSCKFLRKISLPSSISLINEDSFYKCESLREIEIPKENDLFTLKNHILYNKSCSILKKVYNVDLIECYVDGTIKYVEKNAFSDCKKLQDIYFDGTREQWDKLEILLNKSNDKGIDYTKTNILGNDFVILKPLTNDEIIRHNFQCTKSFTINLTADNIAALGMNEDGATYKPLLESLQDRICINQAVIHKADIETSGIPARAFENIENLKTVFFDGTVEEWRSIVPSLEEVGLTYTRVVCTDNSISNIELDLMSFEDLSNFKFVKGSRYKIHVDDQVLNYNENGDNLSKLLIRKRNYIKGVVVDEGVTSLKADTFNNCVDLEEISLPKSLVNIEDSAFNGVSKANLIVNEENTKYSYENSLLITKDNTKVILCSGNNVGNLMTLPSTVTNIASTAFKNNETIKTLGIYDSINNIGNKAFLNMKALETVELYGTNITQESWDNLTVDAALPNNVKVSFYASKPIDKALNYSELDASIPSLETGLYRLTVNCEGVAASEFAGNYDESRNVTASPLGQKLQTAKYGVSFMLIPTNVGSDVTNATAMFDNCSSLTSIDTKGFTNVTDAIYMFSRCDSLTSIDTSGFTKVTNASYMFSNCYSLTSIDTKAFTNVTDASSMFQNCSNLTSIDTKAFTNVTDASGMFSQCDSLTSIDTKAFTNVTNATAMFTGCDSLISIDTSGFTNVTNASNMFYYCMSLTEVIGATAFTKVTDASQMFQSCSNLTSIDTKGFTKVTNASRMFYKCSPLTSIDTKAFTKVTDASLMFSECYSLTSIDTKAFTNVTNASYMFSNCYSLTSIDTKAFTNVTDASSMFQNCSNLTSIDTKAFTKVTDASLMFSECYSLTSIDTKAFTNVTNASYMFSNCYSLTSINWGDLFRPELDKVADMFTNATSPKTITSSADSMTWIDTNATAMSLTDYTFRQKDLALTYSQLDTELPNLEPYYLYNLTVDCKDVDNQTLSGFGSKLKTLPISISINLTPTNVGSDIIDASSMFADCYSLISINLDTFTALTNTSNMFANCRNLTNILWSESLKTIENVTDMFTGADAAKTITAYSDVITWINNNATTMGLTNYTCVVDPREEEEKIVNTIYTGLSEMYNPVISVPSFTFNGVTCNNVDFVFMGIAESEGNLGKAIYMSSNLLPEVHVSMDSLLAGSDNGDVGTGTIGAAAEKSLETAIYDITKKHLQPYVREYDGKTHTEKIFFPLECEVFGAKHYAADEATLNKYPQWESFKKSEDSRIKYIDYQQNKYEPWYWWEANKSRISGNFCRVHNYGIPDYDYSYNSVYGCGVAFCL